MYRRLRILRKKRNLKESDIAKMLNVSQQTYSRYETGDILIDLESIITLAKFYNTSLDYLVGLTNDPTPYEQSK